MSVSAAVPEAVEVPDAGWLGRCVERIDYFRRSPARVGGPGGFKEWMHFCIYGDRLDVLINFSEVDDVRPNAPPGRTQARMTVLVRVDRWYGGVEEIAGERVQVRGGRVHAEYGDSAVWFADGRYHLRVRLREHAITADLTLTPVTTPAPIHNVTVGDGPPIHWVVIPRLLATGTVRVGGEAFNLRDAPAYHDHNWGHFRWGRDFAWEWGFGLPATQSNPWSFVFARLSNRSHTRTRMQTLFLWRGARARRVFRDAQVEIQHRGLLHAPRVHKVPAVMGLLIPGAATDVPARVDISARMGDDHVVAVFFPEEVAQVIIPNDDDTGVTIIHEVAGTFNLDANIRGESVAIRCRTIFEFLGD